MRRRFFNNKIGEKIDLSKPYFAIEALEDGLTVKLSVNACEYCVDNGEWKTLSKATNTMIINNGQTLSFRGNLTPKSSGGIGTFTILKKCNVKGNVMSLLYKDEFEEQTDLTEKNYAFYKLFYNCTNIVNASELILPATSLAENCYAKMFAYCSSLVSAPELPATTLAVDCYLSMFKNCTLLTSTPALPATTLAGGCYTSMFYGCTSLVTAPALPATTLAHGCYQYMFDGCTSLTQAPELPATTLVNWCYYYMFQNCTSLVTAPELPATTLADNCYEVMFKNCTSLTKAPELPATTLADNCYEGMFKNCTSLTKAPELPATTLADNCYEGMFSYCISLTQAPALPATELASECYAWMFQNCIKLNYIKMLATDISANECLFNWVNNVASSGTFVKHPQMTSLPIGNEGIPDGWTVVNYGEENVNLITFYIDNIEYQAEKGMTWKEWVNSEYNTNGFYIKNNSPRSQNGITVICKNLAIVNSYDIIIEAEYLIQSHSDGNN